MILGYKKLILLAHVILVTSCGGGSDAPSANPNPFSLAIFKTLTPGFSKTFNLTGSDSREDTYEGTTKIEVKDPVVLGGKQLIPVVSTITLKYLSRGGSLSGSSTTYNNADGTVDHVKYNNTGVICAPTSFGGLPDTATIGQSGTIAVLDCSDSTTATVTWRLEASGNDAKYIESYVSKFFSGTIDYTEDDAYLLNNNGDILALDINYSEPPDYTLTLSGK